MLFILVTHNVSLIPPTVLSRCRQTAMPGPDHEMAKDWLIHQGITDPDFHLAMSGFHHCWHCSTMNGWLLLTLISSSACVHRRGSIRSSWRKAAQAGFIQRDRLVAEMVL